MSLSSPITQVPILADDEVHLWTLNAAKVEVDIRELSPDEIERAARFVSESSRRMFCVTRYVLRTILCRYLPRTAPSQIGFSYGRFGKPKLENPKARVDFNVSHSAGTAVLAFARNRAIGVDVECLNRGGNLKDIARHTFSRSEFQDLEHRSEIDFRRRFFELWTLKESYIKARGLGLRLPLGHFSFSFQENSIAASFQPPIFDAGENWSFALIKDLPEVMIALTAERKSGERIKLVKQTYQPDL